jgi:hypothetical protein
VHCWMRAQRVSPPQYGHRARTSAPAPQRCSGRRSWPTGRGVLTVGGPRGTTRLEFALCHRMLVLSGAQLGKTLVPIHGCNSPKSEAAPVAWPKRDGALRHHSDRSAPRLPRRVRTGPETPTRSAPTRFPVARRPAEPCNGVWNARQSSQLIHDVVKRAREVPDPGAI